MKSKVIFISLLLLGTATTLHGQEGSLESVKMKIKELSEIEIDAFRNGECETMLNLLDDDISFYTNGKKASKEMVLGFCKQIPRPFEKPSHLETEYIPISSNSAYVIRIMDFSKDGIVYKKEIVTKMVVSN